MSSSAPVEPSTTDLQSGQRDLAAATARISARLDVRDHGEELAELTYLDTVDRLLRADGLDAVHEGGRLTLRARRDGAALASSALPVLSGPLRVPAVGSAQLRERLRASIGQRALLPLAHVRARIRRLDVLDEVRKTVVRLSVSAIEAGTPTGGVAGAAADGVWTGLPLRIRLHGLRGYDGQLHRVRTLLHAELGFDEATEPVSDAVVRAVGGNPAGITNKVVVSLAPGQRADAAAVAVQRRLLDVIEDNLQGTIEDIDPEFLHDFRVAVRRTRSVQRELKGIFRPIELHHYRGEFRWLQQATGEMRDLDVQLAEFDDLRALVPEPMREGLAPLRAVLEDRRDRARERLVTDLRGARAGTVLRDWAALLEELVEQPLDERPDAAVPIAPLVARRVRKVYRQMVRMGGEITPDSPAEDFHALRKRGKELRYLLELFALRLFDEDTCGR